MHYHRSIQEVCINWLAWLTRERFFQRNTLSAVWYTWYNEAWHKHDKKNRAKTALFHPVLHSGTHTKATYRDIGQPLVSNNTSRLSNWFASKSDCHGQLEKPILPVRLVILKLRHMFHHQHVSCVHRTEAFMSRTQGKDISSKKMRLSRIE